MSTFPAISSILKPETITEWVAAKYALSADTTCRLLKAGINHTYSIEDRSMRFIFRIYSHNWRSETDILEEIRLLHHLRENGIAVSVPLADATGAYIQTIDAPEGLRYAVLFSHAPGTKEIHFDSETHAIIGKSMAELHTITHGKSLQRIHYTPKELLRNSMAAILKQFPTPTEELLFLTEKVPFLEQELTRLTSSPLREGIVHLDIWFDNLHISGDTVTLFDFDFCGNGWLCLDIAYYLIQLHHLERDPEIRRQKREAFLQGYQQIHPISADEMAILPVLGLSIFYFYLGIQCRRYNDWSNVFLNENYLKRYIQVYIKGYYEEMMSEATGSLRN